jgi:hypothetical protein
VNCAAEENVDETYQAYLTRVAKQTHPDTYRSQVQHLQESPKFKAGQAVPFPGYTINTPGKADERNQDFYEHLQHTQQELIAQFGSAWLVSVPSESFHFTAADLIWETTYRHALAENPHFEQQLCDSIQRSFDQYEQSLPERQPIELQLLGLLVRPRSLGVVLAPINENSFTRMMELRRSLYQNSDLIALGVEPQYPFTAHIPLCYFGQLPSTQERDRICEQLVSFNDRWVGAEPEILCSYSVGLYHFEDMTHFQRKPHFPTVEF